ncbi:MAG: hypothetical protein AAFX03_11805 [Pseudomonadota bacterium]
MPKVSVILVSYDMAREVPRTVRSFLPPYQEGLAPGDVEILVMENGSPRPVPAAARGDWPDVVRYVEVPDPKPSPAAALNLGVELARAELVCPVIDGARMASPGVLKSGIDLCSYAPNAFVATMGMHLGPKPQQQSVKDGYDQAQEDKLLESIKWPGNGYRLFDISALGGSAKGAWFTQLAETNAPVLSRRLYEELGGYDEQFDIPGGGLVNLDFMRRALEREDVEYFLLLGEGTFHQFHGGVTTSRAVSEKEVDGRSTWQKYNDQYEAIRGKPFAVSNRRPKLYGEMRWPALKIAMEGVTNIAANLSSKEKS